MFKKKKQPANVVVTEENLVLPEVEDIIFDENSESKDTFEDLIAVKKPEKEKDGIDSLEDLCDD